MNKKITILNCILFFSYSGISLADEITLKNGSHLVGEVISKEGNNLNFKTPFAGTIKIKWKNVVNLKTDDPVKILLKDNSIRISRVIKNEKDHVTIVGDSKTETLNQSEMSYIKPELWQLGEGYKIAGSANVSLKHQSGNTDYQESIIDGSLTVRRLKDRVKLNAQYEKAKSSGESTANNWLFGGQYDYFISDKTFWGPNFYLERDEFSDLKLRQSYGIHIGHQYFESKQLNLSIAAGLAKTFEDFDEAEDDNFMSAIWGLNYDQYIIEDFVQLYHRQQGLFSLENSSKYVIKSWTGLRFPLYSGLSISTEAQIKYDSNDGDGVDKTDTTYLLKLGYEF